MIKVHEKPAYNAWCTAKHKSSLVACPNCGASTTAPEEFRKAYYGWWSSKMEFTRQRFDKQFPGIPKNAKLFIDYEAYERDIFKKEYFSCPVGVNRGVWVFRNI